MPPTLLKLEKKPEDTFIGKTLRVFISYSDKDKLVAIGIKNELIQYNIEAFLAHEDIPIGEDWVDTILRNLKQADIFLAVLSKDFKESEWTDQETGIAVTLQKLVIPVSINGQMPYGFMEKYQAFKNFKYHIIKSTKGKKSVSCGEEVFKIIEFLAKREEFIDNLRDCLIISLKNAWTFKNAENIMTLLMTLKPFTRGQVNELILNSTLNNQVYEARKCKKLLPKFLEKYNALIKEENKKEIERLLNQ